MHNAAAALPARRAFTLPAARLRSTTRHETTLLSLRREPAGDRTQQLPPRAVQLCKQGPRGAPCHAATRVSRPAVTSLAPRHSTWRRRSGTRDPRPCGRSRKQSPWPLQLCRKAEGLPLRPVGYSGVGGVVWLPDTNFKPESSTVGLDGLPRAGEPRARGHTPFDGLPPRPAAAVTPLPRAPPVRCFLRRE